MTPITPKSILILLAALCISACSVLPFGSKYGALEINASPKANVVFNGEEIGVTPYYSEKLETGEYSIQLKPADGGGNPWEARIRISPGIKTIVSRELGDTFDLSSGYVLSLEPIMGDNSDTNLLVVTTPDGALVTVDGEPKGFAPASIDNLAEGEHVVIVSSPGYIEKSISANVSEGYKLTASVQLAKSLDPESESAKVPQDDTDEEKDDEENKADEPLDADLAPQDDEDSDEKSTKTPSGAYVEILDTPTGWLNVRAQPNTSAPIVTKVDPGDQFTYLDSEEAQSWYQIELDDGKKGWVSSQYAKLVEE